ncbi:Gp5.5-like host HNS inhibition [Ralstonia phage RPSC1]|uniref:Uncharacterized protein n=1 Tax=Ralstonia phage RPSC1 TaxID=2041351 RepID=A0A2Z2UAR3_9CAUD|nr:Gp5.5-like host HNS inhibition [Ralstonia phage RPSC1]ATN92965.1 hypothetical protein RPSC1_34 [Ralstonia phage RPSC1]
MPRSYRFNVSFDIRIVLSEEEVQMAAASRMEAATTSDPAARSLYEVTRKGTLDDWISACMRHALRQSIGEADMAELGTLSPAKVTRLDAIAGSPEGASVGSCVSCHAECRHECLGDL